MADTRHEAIVASLVEKGWTQAQALGLAANFKAESNFNPAAVGDGGKAYGIGQWHPDRQAEFKVAFGKDIRGSSLEEQLAFADYELRKGKEQRAGKLLQAANDPATAASVVTNHYERPLDKVGESHKRATLAAQWGGTTLPMARQATERGLPASNDYPVVPTAKGAMKDALAAANTDTRIQDVAALAGQVAMSTGPEAVAASTAAGQADAARSVAEQKAADGATFGVGFNTALSDPRVMPTWSLLDAYNREQEDVPPGWDYLNEKDRIEAGRTDEEREYLRENVRGPRSEQEAMAQLAMRQDFDKTYGQMGAVSSFFAQAGAGMFDPASLLAGVAVSKAFTVSKLGHAAMVAAGRPVAGAGALMAEAAVGNVAVEALSDAMGEVKTSGDYVMAAAMGAVMAAPFTRGTYRSAQQVAVEREFNNLTDGAVAHQMRQTQTQQALDPNADAPTIARRVQEQELRDVQTAVSEAIQPVTIREQVVPQSVADEVRREYEGTPDTAKDDPIPEIKIEDTAPPVEGKPAEAPLLIDPNQMEAPTVSVVHAPQEINYSPMPIRPELGGEFVGTPTSYKYGDKSIPVRFESDVDRAAYMITGSVDDAKFKQLSDFLRNAGLNPKQAQGLGRAIRANLERGANFLPEDRPVFNVSDSRMWEDPTRLDKRPPAVDADAVSRPTVRLASRQINDSAKYAQQVAESIMSGEEVIRALPSKAGAPVQLHWTLKPRKVDAMGKGQGNLGQVLKHVLARPQTPGYIRNIARYLDGVVSDDVKNVPVRMTKAQGRPMYDPNAPLIESAGNATVSDSFEANLNGISDYHLEALVHEMVHAATHSKIEAFRISRERLSPQLRDALHQFAELQETVREALPELFKKHTQTVYSEHSGVGYAMRDLHEFAAMVMTNKETRNFMLQVPGKPVAGKASSMWRELMNIVARMLSSGVKKDNAWVEGMRLLDTIIQADGSNIKYMDGVKAVMAPMPGPGALQGQMKAAVDMTRHAKDWLLRNPIDLKRAEVLTGKVSGALTDGLVLAKSKNPIMQMVSGLVTETTTGASGRKATVAIRTKMLNSKLMGNGVLNYTNSYEAWKKTNGGSVAEDLFKGDKRRQFDTEVYEEILNRRTPGYTSRANLAVQEAADALEKVYTDAAAAQKQAGTLGSGNIPDSSVGYIPQALDGTKLQALSENIADLRLVTNELSDQFVATYGWDKQFSDLFAPFYLDRVRRRAQGDKGIDGLSAGGDSSQVVRDALEESAFDPSLIDKARSRMTNAGLGHTKARLNIDLQKQLRPGLRMMDVYVTDPLLLTRTYVKRTAGTVALTESGIHGIRGVRELRRSAMMPVNDGESPSSAELAAYDRVMAEVLGTPTSGDVVSAGAANLQLLVQLQRLGGLVFQQAAEAYNMIHHVGLRSTFNGITELPRMMGEVGRLKRGAPSGNHILTSIEQYGGEIGTEAYKMVAPLDAPDGRLGEYVDQPGVTSRLMRAGGHLQSKVSGFRALMAAQHRMVAEQIVLKAVRYIRDGGNDIALKDMGFTPDIQLAMRQDLPRVAQYDAQGRVTSFDLTQVSDPRVAEAFVQAVHRGTSQIIQGTFIGERNAWFHNDYMKLLLQLRTFGLTAAEKQWGRARMNHGYTAAAGLLVAQMALALPIHLARVQLASVGREDREKFIRDNLTPAALVRATMNYSSMSGLASDVLEILSGIAGGWGDAELKEQLGTRSQSMGVGKVIPAAGTIDSAVKVASGRADLYTALKQLPFSNLWYLTPAINLSKDE